jgi:hypothetical protein
VWEYDIFFVGDPGSAMGVVKARERLGEAGAEGWELVSYVEGYGIFKRSGKVVYTFEDDDPVIKHYG